MPKRQRMHITGTRDNWKGTWESGNRASVTGTTKQEVVDRGGQLIIHKQNGLVGHGGHSNSPRRCAAPGAAWRG